MSLSSSRTTPIRIAAAHDKLCQQSIGLPTPILASDRLNKQLNASLFFKMENRMPDVHSFKMRGALYSLLSLTDAERSRGVVTHSSGNHGQAVALAARTCGTTATVVVPTNAPRVKRDKMIAFGAEIIDCEPGLMQREEECERVQQDTGSVIVHPYNDERTILGQATVAFELLSQEPAIETIVAPVGGGGLLSGTALSARHFSLCPRVVGAEPTGADDAYRSLEAGSIQVNDVVDTIADGLRTNLGSLTFPIIQQHVQHIICVTDDDIRRAMQVLRDAFGDIVEPSGATAFAAVLKEPHEFADQRVGVIVSGGNVDPDMIAGL